LTPSPALDLHFPTSNAVAARVIGRLDDFSPSAIHELGADDAPVWRVFFATPRERDEAARAFEAEFSSDGLACHSIDVPDEDWAARSQAGLRAIRVGRIVVAPPWDVPDAEADAAGAGLQAAGPGAGSENGREAPDITIVIQPSMGFGTGHHETTRLCLGLLQDARLRGLEVLDVGTGSGVLAIAAALLGARHVRAIDVDADALDSARENVMLNRGALGRTSGTIEVTTGNLRDARPDADLVVANLTGGLLVSAAIALRGGVRAGGQLLVSGFQPHETEAVLAALAPPPCTVRRRREGEWEAALIELES